MHSKANRPNPEDGNPCAEHDRTVIEAAAEIRCTPSMIYQLINAAELTAYSRDGLTLIEGPSILEMRLRNRIKPGDLPGGKHVA